MVINGIIDLDNGELLEATGKHRISALDIQGSETAELKLTFYKNGSAVTDNSVVSGAVIDFGVKADADYTGTSYLIYHDTFSASTDGLEYSGTPTWATAEVETALGNESSVKLHGQVKVVISGVTYYSQVFEVEIHNNVIQAAGTTNSVIYPRLIQSASDPTVNDDSLDGYGVSSLWLNTSSNAVHVLMDNTAGAAVWAGFLGLTNGQLANNLVFNDDLKAVFGTSSDGLEIYHNGSNSYISDTGTGDLIIQGSDDIWFRTQGGNNYANFNSNGSVDLYYSNSKKFETTDTGATVSGKLIVSGDLDVDGVTTSFDSTVVNVADPVFGIGGSTPPSSQDNKDRGVSFRYHDGTSAKVGFYGWDNSEDSFVFLTDTNDDSTEVFSGTLADLKASKTLLEDGSASAPSYTFNNDSDTGFYSLGGGAIGVSFNANQRWHWTADFFRAGATLGAEISSQAGSASLPNYRFRDDNNTGIFRADADTLAFTTGGTEAARFDSNGHFLIPDNNKIKLGGSGELELFSDGTNRYIRSWGGDLNIQSNASGKSLIFATASTEAARFDSDGDFIINNSNEIKNNTSHLRFSTGSQDNNNIVFKPNGTLQMTLTDTGLLGIGGTPTRELEVTGTGNVYARITAPSASDSAALELNNTNLLWSLKADDTDSDAFKIINNNGTALTIDANKKVGIGTTPSQALHVNTSTNYQGLLINGNVAPNVCYAQNTATTPTWKAGISGTLGTAFSISQGSANTERLMILDGGNVGIGTNNPATLLQLSGGDISIQGADGESRWFGFTSSVSADTYVAKIESDHDANWGGNLKFFTGPSGGGNAERMRITGSGNVGINCTPNRLLEISEASLSGGAIMRLTSTGETSAGDVIGEIEFYNSDTTDYTPGVMSSIKAIAGPSGGEGHLQFLTNMPSEGADASTVALHLHSNANVGISTTSPRNRLDLGANGTSHLRWGTWSELGEESSHNTLVLGSNVYVDSSSTKVRSTSNDGYRAIRMKYNEGITFHTLQQSVTADDALGYERMRIDSSGNVAIGSTSPISITSLVSSLTLDGTHSSVGGGIVYNVNGSTKAYHYVESDYLRHQAVSGVGQLFYANGAEAMRIDSSGNVGIGTTSPDFALDVGGDIGIDDKIYHNGDHNTYIGFTGSDTISFRTGGTDVITLDSSQRCGIGTTSPSAKLEIEGDTLTYDGMAKIYLTDTATDSGSRNWSIGNGGSAYGNLTFAVSAAKGGNAGDATGVNAFLISSDGDITQNYINYTNGSNYEALKISAESDHILFKTESIGTFSSNTRPILFKTGANTKAQIDNLGIISYANLYISGTGSLRNTTNHLNLSTSTQTDNDIIFKPNDTEAVRITDTGRLGVGTGSTVDQLFHIKDDSAANDLIRLRVQGGSTAGHADFGVQSGYARIFANSALSYATSGSTHFFYTSGGTIVKQTINGNGVGISTTSPSANADLTLGGGELCMAETTTPTADANFGKIYCKSDNKLYFQDGAGTEHEIAFV